MWNDGANRCVCCNEIIPEGRQVCLLCEKQTCLHLWQFVGFEKKSGVRCIRWVCARCGKERLEKPPRRIYMNFQKEP